MSAVRRDANLLAAHCHFDKLVVVLHSIYMMSPADQRLRVAFPLQAEACEIVSGNAKTSRVRYHMSIVSACVRENEAFWILVHGIAAHT